ncbi:hypothetical protein F4808DRAFT_52827 [Astrocystis sublimbata]|nr:hypothetical protein F4808DRAFT_52827 [Astrocystis sublimbata]
MMSILCCCCNRQFAETETKTEAIELPIQPPRARLSKTLSRSDTDMYLSSLLASRNPSQLRDHAYHNLVDPETVDVDDSDEEGPERDAHEPNTGTLGSLRIRLIRRLSHRADTKSASRPTIGNSDEELARRAELKRLMHKRIQEELKSEEEEDDDDDIRLTPIGRPSINNCREPELSGGGPRDAIEFSVSSVNEEDTTKEIGALPETSMSAATVVRGARERRSPRSSYSGSVRGSLNNSYQQCNLSLDKIAHAFRTPTPPYLTPVHLLGGSGRDSPSTASWRLSYSAIHIESYIEPLVETGQPSCPRSPESATLSVKRQGGAAPMHEVDTATNFSNPTMLDETGDTSQTTPFEDSTYPEMDHKANDISSHSFGTSDGRHSPLDVWLRTQDLHCTSTRANQPHSEMVPEHPHRSLLQQEVEGSQKLVKAARFPSSKDRVTSSSSMSQANTLESWPETSGHIPEEEGSAVDTPNTDFFARRRVSSQMEITHTPEDSITEEQIHDVSSRYASSRYTTRPNSRQATLGDSRPSLPEMIGSRRILQPLSSIYAPVSPYRAATNESSDISSYQTAFGGTPSLRHSRSKPDTSQLSLAEVLSSNVSETASFRQREEELKSIKKRFGLTPSRISPKTPVRSRFREEFDDPKALISGKGSIFSKLYLALPRRSRASSSHTEANRSRSDAESHLTEFSRPSTLKSLGLPSNSLQYPLPDLNKIGACSSLHIDKLEEGPRPCPGRAKLIKVPLSKPSISSMRPRPISATSLRRSITGTHDEDQKMDSIIASAYPPPRFPKKLKSTSEAETRDTIDLQTGVLQEWVEQLQAEDVQRHNQVEPRTNTPKRQRRKLRTPPESWAKWPSHTREQRSAPAGVRDKVNSWDFAAVTRKDPLSREEDMSQPRTRMTTFRSRTLSNQVGKALKFGWNKILTHTGSLGRSTADGTSTQHITEPRRFSEYPELEVPPTAEGYREVQALDRQIGTMVKRRSPSGGRPRLPSSSDGGARRSPANGNTKETRKSQAGDETATWAEIECRTNVPQNSQFLSPAHALLAPHPRAGDSKAVDGCESETYEDCVQMQMLHDNGEDGTDKAVIKRAKSTGNIEIKLSGVNSLQVKEVAHGDCGNANVARFSGLRRHKSLGWLRGHTFNSNRDEPTEAARE